MRSVNEGKSSSSSAPFHCDVALGLNMQLQSTESRSCDGNGGSGGSPAFFGYPVQNNVALARGFHGTDSGASGGGANMPVSGKSPFTATQWAELLRQQTIHKYITASVPVPPHLLPPVASQSNISGPDLRFSSTGSDPEPWRCRRTDGKKWRCARDVAPDQKYCDRHAHKSRPRSRKPVELSSHRGAVATRNCAVVPEHSPPHHGDKRGVSAAGLQNDYTLPARFSPSSSLTLSIPGGNEIDDDNLGFIGMTTSSTDRDSDGGLKLPPWMNPWVQASHPGGPLGEALCLGNASVIRGGSNSASPHGYITDSSTDGSHTFNSIG